MHELLRNEFVFTEITMWKFVDLAGSKVRVNLSPSEIVKLANQIIAKSNEVHNLVASVPLDKVLSIRFFMLH